MSRNGRLPSHFRGGALPQSATNLALPDSSDRLERLCEVMHDTYEAAALSTGWQTQERSRVPWADVPEANKATMRAAVAALLREIRS